MADLFEQLWTSLNMREIEAMGLKILAAAAILLIALLASRMLQRCLARRLDHHAPGDEARIRSYKSILRAVVMTPAILLSVHVIGINLSHVFTAGGLLAVAVAFAMKNLSENLVSGLILRLERSIKPGDVLESEGVTVRVKSIGFRATVARTKDEKDLVIPNAQLVQSRVANCTLRDSLCRIETTVGVAYSSDLEMVREVLQSVCDGLDWTSSQHQPAIILSEFGDSAVSYTIRVWTDDPWAAGQRRSVLNEAVWWGLKQARITIAFPQLDVHFEDVTPVAVPEQTTRSIDEPPAITDRRRGEAS
jgi:small-conductance mechanosensitive channel